MYVNSVVTGTTNMVSHKGPEFKGQKLASEKSRGTDKTLKHYITVINVYLSIFKINTVTKLNCIIKWKSNRLCAGS